MLERGRAVVEIGNATYSLRRNLVVIPLRGDEPSARRSWTSISWASTASSLFASATKSSKP
jgi:hypothetical protein